jgi:radical SAM superfamily enzyme YgiQ (UPF0313 family)
MTVGSRLLVHRCPVHPGPPLDRGAKQLLRAILAEGWTDIRWAAYIRADNLDAELAELMVASGMEYFEIGITSDSQELVACSLGPPSASMRR